MKTIIKILTGISILFLLLGSATAAVNLEDLKSPMGYSDIKGETAYLMSDDKVELYIGEMSLNEEVFNNTTEYLVYNLEDNFYIFEDTGLSSYGVQEKVNIDGTDYVVSIDKDTPLSDADKTLFKEDLEHFNSVNNLEPVPV